jgi:hypothetical protein
MTTRQLKEKERSLCFWLERRPTPYPALEDQTVIAEELSLSIALVANFCRKYRRRHNIGHNNNVAG